MLHYVTVGSNDLEKAKIFYDALFASVGIHRSGDLKKGGGIYTFANGTTFIILSPQNGERATPGNGVTIGLSLESPEQVDAIHSTALAMGGTCEGEPGLRQTNMPGAYLAYFRDPDGNKLAAVTMVSEACVQSGLLKSIR